MCYMNAYQGLLSNTHYKVCNCPLPSYFFLLFTTRSAAVNVGNSMHNTVELKITDDKIFLF